MERRTQRRAVCKHQQNFKQSWAKKWKINISLGNSYHCSPGKAFSKLGWRHFHGEESLLFCLQPKHQTGGLSGTQRAGTSGQTVGDQQTKGRLVGAFQTLRSIKGAGSNKKEFSSKRREVTLRPEPAGQVHFLSLARGGVFLRNERKPVLTEVKCLRN